MLKVLEKRAPMGAATQRHQDKKVWGPEPSIPDTQMTTLELAHALNWYNYMESRSDAHGYLTDYLKKINDPRYTTAKKCADKHFTPTAGWLARLLSRGADLPPATIETFNRLVDDCCKLRRTEVEEADDTVKLVEKPNIQARIKNKADDIIADLEDVIDAWRENADFSCYQMLVSKQVSAPVALQISKFYAPLAAELAEAVYGKNADLKEAYKRLKKPDLKAYEKFVKTIIDDCVRHANVAKASKPRKPRKAKKQTPEQKFKHFRFLTDFAPLKIKSVAPANIIGAAELWLFDTKTNKLSVFRSEKGLDIQRSSVVGYDESKSFTKAVGRTAQKMVDSVMKGSKAQARKVFEAVTAKANPPATNRTNEHMIILRVFK